MVAIQRAAQRAWRVARQTHTAIVVARAGRIERIVPDEVRETTDGNANQDAIHSKADLTIKIAKK